jgi:hypothetical protein
MTTQVCERCEVELEQCTPNTRNYANIGMVVTCRARFWESAYAVRTENMQPFWLCLSCAKELQRWVANKEKK